MKLKNLNMIDPRFHADLERFSKVCQQKLKQNLVSIIIFGSIAKNKFTKWSDFDFCVVVKELKKNDALELMQDFDKNCDVLLRREEDFVSYLHYLSPVDLNIFNEGILIFGRDVLTENLAKFKETVNDNNLVHQAKFGKGVWEIGITS